MAVTDAKLLSFIAGTTFASTDRFKGVTLNATGHVVLPDTTDTSGTIVGTLYTDTPSTASAGQAAVSVANGPVVKVRMAASTLAAGDTVGFSTLGVGIAPTTDAAIYGVISIGSSGAAGRIFTVVRGG